MRPARPLQRPASSKARFARSAGPKWRFFSPARACSTSAWAAGCTNRSRCFARRYEHCDAILRRHWDGQSLLDVLYPAGTRTDDPAALVHQTEYTQPALFALEYALAELWRSWGVVPDIVLGHSVGEYAAACVAGVMSLEDGLALIAERARLMQAVQRHGKMAVVFAPLIV